MLSAAHDRWGERFVIDSDGYYADWEEGVGLARKVLDAPGLLNPAPLPGPDAW